MSDLINIIMRDICELEEAALEKEETLVLHEGSVRSVVERHLAELEKQAEKTATYKEALDEIVLNEFVLGWKPAAHIAKIALGQIPKGDDD